MGADITYHVKNGKITNLLLTAVKYIQHVFLHLTQPLQHDLSLTMLEFQSDPHESDDRPP